MHRVPRKITSMEPRPKMTFSFWRMLGWNCLGGLIAPLLSMWFDPGWDWNRLLQATLTGMAYSHTIGTLATFTLIFALPYYKRGCGRGLWAFVVGTLLVLAVVGSLLASVLLVAFGVAGARGYWNLVWESLQFALPITLGIGVTSGLIRDLKARLENSNRMLRERETEKEKAVQLATEARLASLESRVHPHFLFNALNSISSLIREDPVRAERLIERMAALLRFSLDSSHSGFVPLGREIQIVEDYLEIEKVRFGDRLRFSVTLPGELRSAGVPPLSVQTVVENAVKFAVAPRREGGSVAVSTETSGGVLRIIVWDDGTTFDLQAAPAGHGLENLQQRLHASFPAGATLSLQPAGEGKSVVLTMPLRMLEAAA